MNPRKVKIKTMSGDSVFIGDESPRSTRRDIRDRVEEAGKDYGWDESVDADSDVILGTKPNPKM